MISDNGMKYLLVLPSELEIDQSLFERWPLYSVKRFLQCFDSEGNQRFLIPSHILKELADRFTRLMDRELNSLDSAFGGKIARQRNCLKAPDADLSVVWDVVIEHEHAKEITPFKRARVTPLQYAFEKVAKKRKMSAGNVERIWKRARAK